MNCTCNVVILVGNPIFSSTHIYAIFLIFVFHLAFIFLFYSISLVFTNSYQSWSHDKYWQQHDIILIIIFSRIEKYQYNSFFLNHVSSGKRLLQRLKSKNSFPDKTINAFFCKLFLFSRIFALVNSSSSNIKNSKLKYQKKKRKIISLMFSFISVISLVLVDLLLFFHRFLIPVNCLPESSRLFQVRH